MRYIISVLVFVLLNSPAHAGVYVSDMLGMNLPDQYVKVSADSIQAIPVWSGIGSTAELSISINAENSIFSDVRTLICDDRQAKIYLARRPASCQVFAIEGQGKIEAQGFASGTTWLVVDNSASLFTSKSVSVSTYGLFKIPTAEKAKMITDLEVGYNDFFTYVDVEEFDLNIAPCRINNAFSTTEGGHITMCSELIFDTIAKAFPHASTGVLAHEMGHTLPNLWGSPHYANEKAADEFAAAFLFISESFPVTEIEGQENPSPEEVIRDLIKYFESIADLTGEAHAALLGNQHPLSVQRVNNLRNVLLSPSLFIDRWTGEIYPNLTNIGLQAIIDNPHTGADVELAQQLLDSRR